MNPVGLVLVLAGVSLAVVASAANARPRRHEYAFQTRARVRRTAAASMASMWALVIGVWLVVTR